ncbi:MAG: Hpt domain-containing protein [Anaerolineaceae bacterium]|nr:Hpt domain-containing protein [Anaerolineaceae bacterium]
MCPDLEFDCLKPVLVEEILDELKDLGIDIFVELVELFISETPGYLQKVIIAFENTNYLELKNASHNLKGACLNLGAGCMAEICQEIEEKAKEEQAEELGNLILRLKTAWTVTHEELNHYLDPQ